MPAPAPAAPKRAGRRLWFALALGTTVLVIALAAAIPALLASLRSTDGTAWWLARLPGVTVAAPEGAFLGDFSAATVTVELASSTVRMTDVRWRGLAVARSQVRGAWADVRAETLDIGRIELLAKEAPPPPASAPRSAPANLRLPLTLQVEALRIGEVQLAALGDRPLRDIQARIGVGSQDGALHRLELAQLLWDTLKLSGSAQVGADGDMPADVQLALAQTDSPGALRTPPLAGQLRLTGPLAQLALQASVRNADVAGVALLDANAQVQPFAPWPVSALNAQLNQLDLSRFTAAAPRTELSGRATITSPAANQPATLQLTLANAQAGLWSAQRLPLQQLTATLLALPDQASAITLRELVAELGTAQQPAGRIVLQGQNEPQGWTVNATLQDVRPDRLDARAPALALSGPLSASGSSADAGQSAVFKSDLRGTLPADAVQREVRVLLDGSARQKADGVIAVALRQAQLSAGAASAELSGNLERSGRSAHWQVQAQGQFRDFDPLVWWPGAKQTVLRGGPTRINGSTSVKLAWKGLQPAVSAPATAASAGKAATQTATQGGAPIWQALFAAFSGQAQIALDKSQLLGRPLQADLQIASDDAGAGRADLKMTVADNQLSARARLAAQANAGDLAEFEINAPALQKLQPLLALAGLPREQSIAGQIIGKAAVRGRWPDLTSQGTLEIRGLVAGPHRLKQGDFGWQLGTALDAATKIDAKLAGLVLANQPVDSAELTVQGTARAHQMLLRARALLDAPKPGVPATTTSGQSAPKKQASLLLRLQGGLQHNAPALAVAPGSAGMSAWRGTVEQLEAADTTTPAQPWLQGKGIGIAVQWSEAARGVEVQPGRIDFRAGSVTSALRWTRLLWQQASAPSKAGTQPAAVFDIQAAVDPFAVAPVLAQLQPDFGWDGDLVVGGRIALASSPAPVADIVVERVKGDLAITSEDDVRQALGLTDLRFALNGSNGIWNFTQAVAGKAMGVAAGAITARTAPGVLLPDATTPVQGVVELRVANVDAWASWVPAGWRLGGALQTSASIAGKLGAPEFTGQLKGQNLTVRNVLQGVNITDGDVAIAMNGESATVERFTARAGSGTLKITGGAKLGDNPSATLQVVADKFQALGRVDLRVITSGQTQLRLSPQRIALDGKLVVDEGLVDFTKGDAPSLSSDVVVVRAPNAPKNNTPGDIKPATVATPPPANPARQIALNLGVDLGEQLRLKGRGLDTRLAGDLRLTAPGGNLAVNGTVRTVGGNYAAYAQKLTIDRGTLTFTGVPGNPRLDIEATRPRTDIRVGVSVTGTAINPRVRLFSEPDLPEVDKLSWLVLGRASGGLGRTDTALLQRAAVALFAGEEEGVVTQLTKAIGLDEISLRQTDGEVRETIVTLGKQLSERLYVGYERGLNSTAGSFQLIYRIAQRFTLRGQTGADNAVDAIYTWRWK